MSEDGSERRKYQRIQAPVFCRPARASLARKPIDISQGGVRVYSDIALEKGEELKLELFFPEGATVEFTARVVWVETLPSDAPAKFDLGLCFVDLDANSRARLASVLEVRESDPPVDPKG